MDCTRCPELAACRTQIVLATPCGRGGLLAVGEAPGADEDRLGEGFIGTAGRTLDKLLAEHGIARADYGRANICRCRPPGNRKPRSAEVAACLSFLAELLAEVRPAVVLAIGATPTAVFCGKGSLHARILERQSARDWSAGLADGAAHPGIATALGYVRHVVPMPHTSPLAFNRNAPSGEKWAVVARQQVRLAVEMLRFAGNQKRLHLQATKP